MTTCNTTDLSILDNLRIAAPCSADWSKMTGDERSRLCGDCQKHVYDLTVMTPEAAANLIREREGNLCVRMYKRLDGRLIAGNCPVGARAVLWRTGRLVASCVSAAIVGLMLFILPSSFAGNGRSSDSRVIRTAKGLIEDTLVRLGLRRPPVVMGSIACPPPPTTTGTGLESGNEVPNETVVEPANTSEESPS